MWSGEPLSENSVHCGVVPLWGDCEVGSEFGLGFEHGAGAGAGLGALGLAALGG